MPIYTTYLGFLNKHGGAHKVGMELGSCLIYYVMVGRGNDDVAPYIETVQAVKKGTISWDDYKIIYLRTIDTPNGREWMERRAGEAKIGNILLVCYEKDHTHCHRRLLAEEIARRHGVEYKGELSDEYSSGM